MAGNFPWAAADFFDLLPIQDVRFSAQPLIQANNLGGGDLITAEIAPTFWAGSVSLAPMRKRQAAGLEALLSRLERPGATFEAYKAHQIGPASDPLGAALAGVVPEIGELDPGDAHKVKLTGLASGFELAAGDFLAFDYDPGSGSRRAYHQITKGRTHAQADGQVFTSGSFLHVTPEIRAGAAVGAAVQLVQPSLIAVLVPGSVQYGITVGNITSGISFDFRQTFRG